MKWIRINRNWQDKNQTLGNCTVFNEEEKPIFSGLSLERGWRDNRPNISCIPLGTYRVVLEWSPRFKTDLWEIKGVEGRSECKFHSANYWYQLNGCIALGRTMADINKDGYNDITSSRSTMNAFHKALNGETEAMLQITQDRWEDLH